MIRVIAQPQKIFVCKNARIMRVHLSRAIRLFVQKCIQANNLETIKAVD